MRPLGSAAAVLACVSCGLLSGCFDLFHSTADILTACEIDAATPGCVEPMEAAVHEDAAVHDAEAGAVDALGADHGEAE